jgi:hypothetical protein
MKKTGGGAFPCHPSVMPGEEGMSLRDWFAGQVILKACESTGFGLPDRAAEYAYKVADAMLEERQK